MQSVHQYLESNNNIIDYAIGDVHGCLDQLIVALNWCASDALKEGANGRVILLGDFVDKGPNSKGVIDYIMQGPDADHMSWHPIKGNHDDLFATSWFDPENDNVAAWWEFGGQQTLMSYGWNPLLHDLPHHLEEWVPEGHANFISSLPITISSDTHIFVHAGLRPEVELKDQTLKDLMWIRSDFYRSQFDFGKTVVHGHTPDTNNPINYGNRIAMDSGCYGSDVLAIVALSPLSPKPRFHRITVEDLLVYEPIKPTI